MKFVQRMKKNMKSENNALIIWERWHKWQIVSGVACWANQQKTFLAIEDNAHNSTIGNNAMPMVEMFQCLIIKLRTTLKTYVNITKILIPTQHYNANL
jgi:hypothetical protein